MEAVLKPKTEVWRSRGRPRREVDPDVAELTEQTYKSGQCAVVKLAADDTEDEIRELVNMVNAYARSQGKRATIQREDGEIRWIMIDVGKRAKEKTG